MKKLCLVPALVLLVLPAPASAAVAGGTMGARPSSPWPALISSSSSRGRRCCWPSASCCARSRAREAPAGSSAEEGPGAHQARTAQEEYCRGGAAADRARFRPWAARGRGTGRSGSSVDEIVTGASKRSEARSAGFLPPWHPGCDQSTTLPRSHTHMAGNPYLVDFQTWHPSNGFEVPTQRPVENALRLRMP